MTTKLYIHANLATFNQDFGYDGTSYHTNDMTANYGTLIDGAIAVADGKIIWVGASSETLAFQNCQVIDCQGKWITPALIDCHTHLVYAGNRSHEFEARLAGVSYGEIAKAGGGILSTVRATRAADFNKLYQDSIPRLQALMCEGVATIEIKSGYGLNLEHERKMLQVARKLGKDFGITVRTTYLAAHALPEEYQGDADGYIQQVCQWLHILHAEGLIDAVDGFMEHIAFDDKQIRQVFDTAKALGLPVKLHADQITNMGGSTLVAKYQGLSSDHLEQLSEQDIIHMAEYGTIAVLLPGAFYTLRDTTVPPIDLLRKYGVPMAVSTDCNPGTSPLTSILLAMNMACTLFRLTPSESLAGATIHAAKALGLQDKKGQIKVGLDANLAIWHIDRPADLCYLMGFNPLDTLILS